MAEGGKVSKDGGKRKSRGKGENSGSGSAERGEIAAIPECAVCLQTCVHPARLPCSHIFCFLCLKGLATQSRRCAMCRQDIPPDYIDHPDLLEVPNTSTKEAFEDGYQWFYEGRSGWWQYDERTSRELEIAYKSGHRTCELLIVGQLYTADFDAMLQFRKSDMSRRRRIKRDLASIPIKGIAGLRFEEVHSVSEESNGTHPSSSSQEAIPNRCEPGQNSTQISEAESNFGSSQNVTSQACNSNDDDSADGVNRSEDIVDLEVDAEGRDHGNNTNDCDDSQISRVHVHEDEQVSSDIDEVLLLQPRLQNLWLG